MSLDFVRRLFRSEENAPSVLQLFTPNVVGPDRPAARLLLGGVTLVGLAVAGAVALSSFLALLGALLGIYFLLTQVLGLRLDFDPRSFMEEAQRYAASAKN
jgi:hypothetical protein